ncbi:hypothetical protein [Tsukamurella spumae]|uniref:Lipoprotein n=1 Tax=Tsukamurella spumae TaxID=44753 RepID=A0A846X4X6_9ACTN|nr:hypothetical protein [Tsukamurella spumae]NKY18890.1 hypothetical protein [Tsukamurella spumae]
MRTPYAIAASLLATALLVSGCSRSTDDGGAPATKAKAGKEVLFGASCKEAAHDSLEVRVPRDSQDPRSIFALSQKQPEKFGFKEPTALELGPSGGTITEIPEDKIDILQTSWEKLFEKADPEKMKTSIYRDWVVGFYGDPDTKPDGRLAEGTYLCAFQNSPDGNGPGANGS